MENKSNSAGSSAATTRNQRRIIKPDICSLTTSVIMFVAAVEVKTTQAEFGLVLSTQRMTSMANAVVQAMDSLKERKDTLISLKADNPIDENEQRRFDQYLDVVKSRDELAVLSDQTDSETSPAKPPPKKQRKSPSQTKTDQMVTVVGKFWSQVTKFTGEVEQTPEYFGTIELLLKYIDINLKRLEVAKSALLNAKKQMSEGNSSSSSQK